MPSRASSHSGLRREEIILGVDTHKDTHVTSVITMLGVLVATAAFPTTAAGYRQLLAWARGFGLVHRAGVEGTGSYGAALTRYLRRQHIAVVEVNRPDRAARRRHGETDTDATAAAHAVLSARATSTARTGDGPVEMLRLFRLARASAIKSRTQAINQLKAVVIGADPALRETLSGLSRTALIRHCATLPAVGPTDVATATVYTLRHLARRIQSRTIEERDLEQQITAVLNTHAPQLLQRHGVGPDSAAALLVTAGDNPDRMHTEAAFAALCGVSPIEASSGKTRRRRLNRGGDRRANAALYRIALTRSRSDQRTRDYLDRRTTQGLTPTRGHPLLEALHRPRDLPATPTRPRHPHALNGLTNIGASVPTSSPRAGPVRSALLMPSFAGWISAVQRSPACV